MHLPHELGCKPHPLLILSRTFQRLYLAPFFLNMDFWSCLGTWILSCFPLGSVFCTIKPDLTSTHYLLETRPIDIITLRFCVLGPEQNFFIISAPPQTRSSPMSRPFYPSLFCKHQQAILNMSSIKIIFNFYVTMFVWTFTAGCFLAPSLRAIAMNNELCFKELTVSRSSSKKREGCWVLRKGAIRTGDWGQTNIILSSL